MTQKKLPNGVDLPPLIYTKGPAAVKSNLSSRTQVPRRSSNRIKPAWESDQFLG